MEHRVTRCICFDIDFDDIWDRLCAGESISQIHKDTGCGGRCGLCVPYLKILVQTGDTSLPVMWSDDFRKAGVSPSPIDRIEANIQSQNETERPPN